MEARKHSSSKIIKLMEEITPEEMEQKRIEMEKTVLTAEEMLDKHSYSDKSSCCGITTDNRLAMIEFARQHVKAALQAAANVARVNLVSHSHLHNTANVNYDTILNAYGEENIK